MLSALWAVSPVARSIAVDNRWSTDPTADKRAAIGERSLSDVPNVVSSCDVAGASARMRQSAFQCPSPEGSMRQRLSRSAQLVLLAGLLLLNACTGSGRSLSAGSASLAPASLSAPSTTIDCESLVSEVPARAADILSDSGHSVAWREVQTKTDGSAVADVVASPPPGVIIDIIFDGDLALIFVAAADDPAAASPPPPTC